MISLTATRRSTRVQSPTATCRRCRQTSVGKGPMTVKASVSPLTPAGAGVARFCEQHTWAQSALQLQEHFHEAVQQSSEPLKPEPTVYSAQGMLSIVSPSAEITVTSHAGEHIVSYKSLSVTLVPGNGIMQSKTSVFANMEQGTPFLECGVSGNDERLLVAMMMSPRLATPLHPEYLQKYYESTPASWATKQQGSSDPATRQASASLLTWVELYTRMAARTQPTPASKQGQFGARGSQSILKGILGQHQGPGQGGGSRGSAAAPVYDWYHVTRLGTRAWGGHAAFWTLDPRNPEAMEAVEQDLSTLAQLWGAWVRAEAGAPPLPSPLLEECKAMSAVRAQSLRLLVVLLQEVMGRGQEDVLEMTQSLVGLENAIKVGESMSGLASLRGKPWWAT